MAHRHVADHACQGRPARAGFLARLVQQAPLAVAPAARAPPTKLPAAIAAASRPAAACAPQRPLDPTITLRESAARRMRPSDAGERERERQSAVATTSSLPPPEACPQCSAHFSDIGALIAHVEAVHGEADTTAASPRNGGSMGIGPRIDSASCLICGAIFSDATMLVRHTTESHRRVESRPQSDWNAAGSNSCIVC
jgi:hypothetical protein